MRTKSRSFKFTDDVMDLAKRYRDRVGALSVTDAFRVALVRGAIAEGIRVPAVARTASRRGRPKNSQKGIDNM